MPKKKKTSRKRTAARHHSKKDAPQKDPEYMVQVSDPKMLRKDILESLREVIIFMQGYEKFRKVQEEKVMLFTQLKAQVKELTVLLQSKMYLYFPKGKLRAVTPREFKEMDEEEEEKTEKKKPEPQTPVAPVKTPVVVPKVADKPHDELEDLEAQLKDIEQQLQGIQ